MKRETKHPDCRFLDQKRREFLTWAAKLSLASLAALPAVLFVKFSLPLEAIESSDNYLPASFRLASHTIPSWHPNCSAYQDNNGMRVRLEIDANTFEQISLDKQQARLWCLCDGCLSETDLARVLATEQRLDPIEAARLVETSLQPLYRQGILVQFDSSQLAQRQFREIEGSIKEGEAIWQRLTT
jgi:hypothetical protein